MQSISNGHLMQHCKAHLSVGFASVSRGEIEPFVNDTIKYHLEKSPGPRLKSYTPYSILPDLNYFQPNPNPLPNRIQIPNRP